MSQPIIDRQGWNQYWEKKNRGGAAYALVAEFYRKFIIRPNLTKFATKWFHDDADLLHAGCGSGQVDEDIRTHFHLTGLDISPKALEIYRQCNPGCRTLHASIFETTLPDASFDGIYNLGVMEHFTEPEISQILKEFRRILRPNGKLLLFWPPEYGLSVLFFKVLRRSLRLVTGKDYEFHPEEITRVRSKAHVTKLLEAAGYRVLQYSFGPRDVWTYSIIVAQKTP